MGSTEPGDQESRIQDIQECKQNKRNAKRHMTRLLNKLAAMLSEDDQIPKTEIKDMLHKIEEQQDHTIMVINRLENSYRQKNEEALADKVSDEIDDLLEQIDRETRPARLILASRTKVKSRPGSVADSEASLRRREKEKAEQEARLRRDQLEWQIEQNREQIQRQEKELHAVNQELNKRRQELEDEIDGELGLEKDLFEDYHPLPMQQEKLTESEQLQQEVKTSKKSTMESDKHETHHSNNSGHVHSAKITPLEMPKLHRSRNSPDTDFSTENRETHGQLERIRIPIFSGNKMDFQRWNAAFTSCVDMSSLSPQFKMLRLKACLAGEAANTIKGLGYSLEAYEAAKARLFRKYGGSRRQIQSHLEELKKLQPIQDNNAKELETFADVLERAVITLKENNRNSDLEPGALHTTILEKIPERLLTQYYRWVDENKYRDSLETLKDWISEEAAYQMQATEIKNGISVEDRNEPPRDEKHNFRRRSRSYFGDKSGKGNQKCCLCAGNHPLMKCEAFKKQSVDGRWQTVKRFGLCFRCLADNHHGKSCPRSKQCGINGCKGTHQNLLHYDKTPTAQPHLRPEAESYVPPSTTPLHPPINAKDRPRTTMEGNGSSPPVTMETFGNRERQQEVALRTVPVILKNGNRRVFVNCLLDEGSDTTYVNEDVINEIGLTGKKEPITVNVANAQTICFMSGTFEIGLESTDGRVDTKIIAKTSNKICGGLKAVNWVNIQDRWNHLREIPFPRLAKGNRIDVLLGADHYELMYSMKEVRGAPNEPCARLCPLGWTAIGNIQLDTKDAHYTGFHHTFRVQIEKREPTFTLPEKDTAELNCLLKRFWDLESIGITPSGQQHLTPEDKSAWKKVSNSLKFDGQHYEVAVPWRDDRPQLPNNLPMAKKRLVSTERKLMKDKEVAVAYQLVLNDYLDKKYIRRVPDDEPTPECQWLLPHFPVVRPEKATSKVRIVFDGSAPFEGKSLNTEALTGPKLQSDIFDILVKFRKEWVALVGDISQMYHQLVLLPEDRPMHRFLWRNMQINREPEVYEFLRFVFGGCYCPFCAQFTWQKHAEIHQDTYPLAAVAVKNHCYMDDLMPSLDSVEKAIVTRRQLTEMGDKAGFHVRKWVSNLTEVLADVPEEDRASEVDLEKNELPVTKTLGVSWTAREDQFLFHYSPPPEDFEYTKRSVLRKTATLFDPLGFLSPFVIRAKLFMQQAWLDALAWDEVLPSEQKEEWRGWFAELPLLEEIKIPRCLKDTSAKEASIALHTFSDASERAYTAAVYSRHEYQDGSITTRLIASKTRLAPLKTLSIPRLELLGALIGLRLANQVCSALAIPSNSVTYWVDSLNVGYWIQGKSREYKPFVAHRVGEIHEHSNPDQWRYVPTSLNPADLGTRGMTALELTESTKWWNGPDFLRRPAAEWPDRKFDKPSREALTELKSTSRQNTESSTSYNVIQLSTKEGEAETDKFEDALWRLHPSRYSKWYKVKPKGELEVGLSLVRVRSWVQRFVRNCRSPADQREFGELTPAELSSTETDIIREAQNEAFSDEVAALSRSQPLPRKSTLLPCTPILINRILRSNTRLRHADDLPADVKFPVILPKKHHVTRLIVQYYHESEGHRMGVNFTINHLREKYLVIHVREEVKRVNRECRECARRFKVQPVQQQMAPLPQIRLQMTTKPFANCAVDFGGPYLTIQGRGRSRAKRYLCLFLCLQTHCCHLEMATSLETDAFLNAFVRMTARRGWPTKMLSDNGSNFVGAEKEIRELVGELDHDQVQRMTSNQGVTWYWNPPSAPHFGGVFEAMIKSSKRAIYAILKDADVTDEELQTTFIGVESLMNSRPLTALSDDPNDEPVLTPNHFLIGQMGGDFVPESVDNTAFNPRRRWRRVQELTRHVWGRWMKEYLPHIGSRQKWFFPTENLKVGDVVMVIDPSAARREWKVGRIERTYPGSDQLVRVVDVRVGDKILKRSVTRISPLEFAETD